MRPLVTITIWLLQHGFVMYKAHRWARVQVDTIVRHAKDARQSFREDIRKVLDDM